MFAIQSKIHVYKIRSKIHIQCIWVCVFKSLQLNKKLSKYDQKYHNHTLQTNPRHRKEEPLNIYSNKTFVRQQKHSNRLFLPLQDDCKLERTQGNAYQRQ